MSSPRADRFRELTLSFLWRQWTALGVAGHAGEVGDVILDPEALLLATTQLAREPRLFDEVLDWLNANGALVNLQRLRNLATRIGEGTILEAMAAHLAKRTVHSKWKTLLREPGPVERSMPLFSGVPVFGPPDERFASRGWLRGQVNLRRLSQPPDPHRSSNLLIKLRGLFGMQARAEVMAYLLAFESGHPREMAERLGYFPRTLQTTLNDMAGSGHVMARREGHEKRFWIRRDDWRFLITWPTSDCQGSDSFPRWVDWASFFAAIESFWHFLNRPGLNDASPAVQAIELRSCLESMNATFLRENINIPSGATGAKLVEEVLERFCQLLG
ncbi:MAG: hypothetical protein JNK85_16745 [Verrucomicrobiales bacterium]|nr:hypothetical protein [Verrucomicrobiales bacterium]